MDKDTRSCLWKEQSETRERKLLVDDLMERVVSCGCRSGLIALHESTCFFASLIAYFSLQGLQRALNSMAIGFDCHSVNRPATTPHAVPDRS